MADEPTDRAIFEQAIAPPAPEVPPPVAEPVVPTPAETPPPAPAPEPPVPVPPVEQAIPSWRLREESDARRAAEDRARQLQDRIAEIESRMKQQQAPPDFSQNPELALRYAVAQALEPMVQEMNRAREQDRRERMYMGKQLAENVHGRDTVSAAEKAFLDARDSEALDPAEYEGVVQSPNRYDAVVRWHRQQIARTTFGDDPKAWFERELEARMATPEFQAQMLEKVQAKAAQRPSVTSLPPSLSRATAAAANSGDGVGDMSDSSLFAAATRGMKR